ncbi:dihydroorotate dehydrogenase electron transfer subunit [Eubacterium oxidoreducens]|uniref:Dihydroorotate dehydrogenase B (NAD(+)), electron transfer subunit n=1 Tax=Eubacterium oxidoreducens TaxID=1732 RepID=A0A1G6BCY0_EUBOX|nr:dihydroorotate dehydrogenase electron transfer subunit [Eubacterium oxidoreducens]SDB18454.1 dihydroorotate dehydrogenase electron transfer subunit [Eubacterium oxidoreducens]
MSDKKKECAKVISQEMIATDVYSMWLSCPEVASVARPGQFISLYCADEAHILPRPISLCEIAAQEGKLRIVYRKVGFGTEEFSQMKEGDEVVILGPLGNGFSDEGGKAILVGGGIGVPPMLEFAKHIKGEKVAVMGYRNQELFLKEEFEQYLPLIVATEDGSAGTKGNVIDAITSEQIKGDVIYACGPMPMLRALKEFAAKHQMKCYISLEEKMACGIGACLGCVCKTKHVDEHSKVHNARICTEGPVFDAEEVEI